MLAEIDLVEHEQMFRGGGGKHGVRRPRAAGIGDFQQQVRRFDLAHGALDALRLDPVRRLAHAGGVDQAQRDAVQVDDFLDGVAGGAGDLADDGPLEA